MERADRAKRERECVGTTHPTATEEFCKNNNNNKKSFDEKNTKKKVKEREAKKDGLSLRSMAVVPVVRFGVVEITKSAEERVKIVNDTNRNWKICEYRFEGEEDKSEYELFGFAGGVLPKIVKRDEEMTVSIKWTPKVVSKKATAVGALKLVCKTSRRRCLTKERQRHCGVRLRGVTVVKKEEGTTEKPRKQERDKMEAMIDEGDSEEEDAFGANKENVIEDDAFDEAYEGFKGLRKRRGVSFVAKTVEPGKFGEARSRFESCRTTRKGVGTRRARRAANDGVLAFAQLQERIINKTDRRNKRRSKSNILVRHI